MHVARSVIIVASLLAAAPHASAQTYTVASTAADGTPGNDLSYQPAISANGRFVAFASTSTNLVANDTNQSVDVFVKDMVTQAIARVSLGPGGEERAGESGLGGLDVSDDGQIVAFTSRAQLVAADTSACADPPADTDPCTDVYVHDRGTGATTRVSQSTLGVQPDQRSLKPRLSADGRFVVFSSFATNLVPSDTNGVEDVFLHDRLTGTTTRMSVKSDGSQGTESSRWADISDDGAVIAFLSRGSSLADPNQTDLLGCAPDGCWRAYFHVRETGETSRAYIGTTETGGNPVDVDDVAIDGTGRRAAVKLSMPVGQVPPRSFLAVVLHDRLSGRSYTLPRNEDWFQQTTADDHTTFISGNGNIVVASRATGANEQAVLFDRRTSVRELTAKAGRMSFDGRYAVSAEGEIRVWNYDSDGDGMHDTWERTFNLNPLDGTDATFDPDNDGRTNLQEFLAGSHPANMSTRYFAEGASNGFFSTRIALFNPSSNQVARVTLRLLGASGETTSIIETLQPKQPKSITFTWNSNIPEDTFSTVIESDLPVVADRVMAWGEGGYGEHMERAIEAPATTWYLAEGATHGSFNLFYLLQNANTTEATVTVTYLRLAPATPVVKTYTVEAHSRRTIWVDDEGPELAAAEISAVITANVPIIAERAMYADRPGQPFAAGHEGAGVSELATNWFLAEGATGSFFDMYVLVGNPGTSPAALTVSYLLPSGERFSKPYVVGPQNRLTISVDGEDPRLLNTPVSVIVESTQPVVVERAMWWPSPNWYETHLSAGSTTTGTKWALAANDIGQHYPELDNITYILIANTSNTQGTAAITIYPDASLLNPGPGTVTLSLPPNSRTTYPISFISSRYVQGFAAEIEADVPIVVERAMYKTRDGVTWTTGSAALATKLQ